MIASGTIIIDGQTYRKGDVIHDLGGWDCIDTDGSKRYYWGKSSEVDKLPHYVASGSTALLFRKAETSYSLAKTMNRCGLVLIRVVLEKILCLKRTRQSSSIC